MAYEKPKQVALEGISDQLDSNLQSLKELKLLSEGNVLATYNRCGTLIIYNLHTKNIRKVKNDSPIVCIRVFYPHIITVHESNEMQILNVTAGSLDLLLREDLKSTQCILADNEKVLCISPKWVCLWWRSSSSSLNQCIQFSLQDSKCKRNLAFINNDFCSLLYGDRFLIGNQDAFQIWTLKDIDKEDPSVGGVGFVFEGRGYDETQKFINIVNYEDTVVTNCRGVLSVWSANQDEVEASPVTIIEQIQSLATYIFLDDTFLITGDNNGLLTLRERKSGNKLYDLNKVEIPPSDDHVKLSLERRVTSIRKVGRWVIAGYNKSCIRIWDINQDNAERPVMEYVHPFGGSVKFLRIDARVIIGMVGSNKKANSERAEKPEIVFWSPKLSGFEVFTSEDTSSSINTLYYTYSKIFSTLQGISNSGEDVKEFTTTADRLQILLRKVLSNTEVQISFLLIKDLQQSMDEFFDMLQQLSQRGKLARFMSSNRLRGNLERCNVMLLKRINRTEIFINNELDRLEKQSIDRKNLLSLVEDSEKEKKNQFETNLVLDPDAQAFWSTKIKQDIIEWSDFIVTLKMEFKTPITPQDELQLAGIMDNCNTGYVSQYKFSEFIRGFGPFKNCIENMKSILSKPWFHGFISHRECELLLLLEPDGTFLIRFSKTRPGSFALAFKLNGVISHILIDTCVIRFPKTLVGFKIREKDAKASSSAKMFKSLHELVEHYQFCLKIPYTSSITKESWFFGDLSSEETNELLSGQEVGTFCVRFSSSGTLAISFVDSENTVRHALIQNVNGMLIVPGNDYVGFTNVKQIVEFYQNSGIFTQPLRSKEIEKRKKEEEAEKQRLKEQEMKLQMELEAREKMTREVKAEEAKVIEANWMEQGQLNDENGENAYDYDYFENLQNGNQDKLRNEQIRLDKEEANLEEQERRLEEERLEQERLEQEIMEQERIKEEERIRREEEERMRKEEEERIRMEEKLRLEEERRIAEEEEEAQRETMNSVDNNNNIYGKNVPSEIELIQIQLRDEITKGTKDLITIMTSLRSSFEAITSYPDAVSMSKRIRDASQYLEEGLTKLNQTTQDIKLFISGNPKILPPKIPPNPQVDEKLNKLRDIAGLVIQKIIGSLYFLQHLLSTGKLSPSNLQLLSQLLQSLANILTKAEVGEVKRPESVKIQQSVDPKPQPERAFSPGPSKPIKNSVPPSTNLNNKPPPPQPGQAPVKRVLPTVSTSSPNIQRPASVVITTSPTTNEVPSNIQVTADGIPFQKKVIEELINTEREYVRDLNIMVEVFLLPLKFKKIASDSDINTLFSNLEAIFNVNAQILKDWDSRDPNADEALVLGQIFNQMCPFLKMYLTYTSNQPLAMQKFEDLKQIPEFNNTMKVCESDTRVKSLNLLAYLIKPVQRICKYPLLFNELMKNTPKEQQQTIDVLLDTKLKIEEVVQYVNEGKRIAESMQKIVDLQHTIEGKIDLVTYGRRFIKQGNLTIKDKHEESLQHVILFNDMMLLTKQKLNNKTGKSTYEVKVRVNLDDAKLVMVGDSDDVKNAFEVVSEQQKKNYLFICPSEKEKDAWLKEMKQIKKDIQRKQYESQFGTKKEDSIPLSPSPLTNSSSKATVNTSHPNTITTSSSSSSLSTATLPVKQNFPPIDQNRNRNMTAPPGSVQPINNPTPTPAPAPVRAPIKQALVPTGVLAELQSKLPQNSDNSTSPRQTPSSQPQNPGYINIKIPEKVSSNVPSKQPSPQQPPNPTHQNPQPLSPQPIKRSVPTDPVKQSNQPVKQTPVPTATSPATQRPTSTRVLPVAQNPPQKTPAPSKSSIAPVKTAPVKSAPSVSQLDDLQKSIESNFNDMFDIINEIPGADSQKTTTSSSSEMDDVMSKLESELEQLSKH